MSWTKLRFQITSKPLETGVSEEEIVQCTEGTEFGGSVAEGSGIASLVRGYRRRGRGGRLSAIHTHAQFCFGDLRRFPFKWSNEFRWMSKLSLFTLKSGLRNEAFTIDLMPQ